MSNRDKLIQVFSEALGIKSSDIAQNLEYNSIPEWDSVSHMVLISGIDSVFNVMLETDDVIDLSSFQKAIEILKKYGIDI